MHVKKHAVPLLSCKLAFLPFTKRCADCTEDLCCLGNVLLIVVFVYESELSILSSSVQEVAEVARYNGKSNVKVQLAKLCQMQCVNTCQDQLPQLFVINYLVLNGIKGNGLR